MLGYAPAHPPAITTTSDRSSGLHPIRHAQGAILGLLGAPARTRGVPPAPERPYVVLLGLDPTPASRAMTLGAPKGSRQTLLYCGTTPTGRG